MIMIGIYFRIIYPNLLLGLKKWQMLFYASKCKVMHIGKSQKKYPYYMNNQQLEEVTQEKDLGILISNSLSTLSISMQQSNENSGNYQLYYCVQTSGYYVTSLQVTGQTPS